MCVCTPEARTPYCGKPGCTWPGQKPDNARMTRNVPEGTEGSGFFDLKDTEYCSDPQHEFPNMLHIPVGKGYTHKCPGCGKVTTVTNPGMRL